MKWILLFFIPLFSFACSNQRNDPSINEYETIRIKPGNSTSTNLSEIATDIKYIKLETTDECLISHISRFVIFHDKFFIWDGRRKSVLCFNMDGDFLYKIGRKGNGPGEYTSINDMYIDKEQEHVVIWDLSKQTILRYSLTGEFINKTSGVFFANQIAALKTDSYWFYTMGDEKYSGITTQHNLLHVKSDGKTIISSYFPYNPNTDTFLHRAFSNDNNFLAFWYAYCDTIYRISDSGANPYFFIDFNQEELSKALADFGPEQRNERNKIIHSDAHANLHDVLVSSDYLYFSYANSSWVHKVIYSLKTGKQFHIKLIKNDIDGIPLIFQPKVLIERTAYIFIDPISIIETDQTMQKVNSQDIKTAFPGIQIEDNPILAIIKLKKF